MVGGGKRTVPDLRAEEVAVLGRVRRSFSLTKEQDDALRRLAAAEGRSVNAIVVDAVEAYLRRRPRAEPGR
jgi:hypothetical protein